MTKTLILMILLYTALNCDYKNYDFDNDVDNYSYSHHKTYNIVPLFNYHHKRVFVL